MKLIFLAGVNYSSIIGGRTVRLAQSLVPGNEVHFVEIPSLRRLRFFPGHHETDGISVHSMVPFYGKFWYSAVAAYLRKQIGTDDAHILISNPFWQPLTEFLPDAEINYDCLDYIGIHAPSGCGMMKLQRRETALIQRSRHIFLVSPALAEHVGAPEKSSILPNAVPECWFQEPLRHAENRIIGFHGALYEWIDYSLLERIADELPDCTLRLIGPVRYPEKVAKLRTKKNVELYPECGFSDLPEKISSFRVGIIPFKDDEVSRCADPMKTYEYLCMGKPVLTTVKPVTDIPFVYHVSGDRFIGKLKELLNAPPPEVECREASAPHTWRVRAESLVKTLSGGRRNA